MNILRTLILTFFLSLTVVGQAHAVDFLIPRIAYTPPAENRISKPQDLQAPRLSEIAYRQFQRIQKLIADEKYDQSLSALSRLAKRYQSSPYLVSIAMKSAAYIYITQDDYTKAITWMTRTLALAAMSTAELQTIRHDLSQLQMQSELYQNAANTMNNWLTAAKPDEISLADYQFLAIVEFHLKNFKTSKQAAQKGLSIAKRPVESLYQILLSCDLALKYYDNALKTLTTLVKLNPTNKHYWQQLTGIYDLQTKPDQALAILELMAQRDMLNSESERIQYIQRLVHQSNSYKAATLLSRYMEAGKVKKSVANRLLLADAWERSGENKHALELLKNLPPEQIQARLVRIYTEEQQWQNLADLLEPQLSRPTTNKNETLLLQLGYAFNKLGKLQQAIQVFSMLVNAKETNKEAKKSASDWLVYLKAQQPHPPL